MAAQRPRMLRLADPTAATSRRDQLLDAAARQLNSKGISLTSLTDIADQLGFSRASLYYYIENREDLMSQVYRRSCEIMARYLGEAVQSGDGTLQIVRIFISRALDPAEPELAALSEIGLLNEAERETVLGIYEAIVARLASVLEAGAKSGQIRSCDYPVVARAIISIIHSTPLHATLAAKLKVSRTQIISLAADLLVNGWAVRREASIDLPAVDLAPLLNRPGNVFDRGAILEARREKILACASQLFNRKGVDTTSLDDIAAAVGATKRTLYHCVGDKRTILSACYERTHRIHLFIREQAQVQGGGLAIDTLVATLRATLIAQQRDDIEPLRASAGFESLSPEEQIAGEKRGRELVLAYRSLCLAAQDEGSMRELRCEGLLVLMRGIGAWLAKGLVRGDDARRAQIAAETTDVLRLGLRPL